jgi:hypothetical protein
MTRQVLAWVVAGSMGAAFTAASDQPMIGESAPEFRLESLVGETVGLADLRGKIVVLHFGAGW